jgi:hypothetical protein
VTAEPVPTQPEREQRITEAYCASCGRFIAASPKPDVLYLAERIHACAPGEVSVDRAAEFGRCRITRYLREGSSSAHLIPAALACDEDAASALTDEASGLSK